MLRLFAVETPGRLANLRAAAARGDAVALAREAHALKGEAGVVGARGLEAAAREIEGLGRAGGVEEAAPHLVWLEATYEHAYQALRSLVAADQTVRLAS